MDSPTFFLLLPFLLTSIIYVFTISGRRRTTRLPPGPYPFPIIGDLLKLGDKPHSSLAALSRRYGPLMSLKLGSKTTIVVSSPDVAKEFFHKHDQSFSSRSIPYTARMMNHHAHSIAWLPARDQWRKLRKIAKRRMFSCQSLDGSERLRMKKVQELVDHVTQCCTNVKAVNVGAIAFTTNLNILSNLLFSKDICVYDSKSSQEFKDVIRGLNELAGKPNLVDFFPILKFLDPQGLASQGNAYAHKLFAMFDTVINQRLQTREKLSSYYGGSCTRNIDVLDSLLDIYLKDESELSRKDIKHLLTDLFIGGTETVSTTLEWAMAELIRNPEKMKLARLELIKQTQSNNTTLHEHDIPRLHYLHAVIKETLRLHPPAPFLLPHRAIHDEEVEGFTVPKNSQILCNVWAIGRDPHVWSNPKVFMPERFFDVNIDYRGQDFELIPFGAGRRICPGLDAAHRTLHMILASLIYKFDWKLEGNMSVEDMDMEDKFGLTLPKKEPLVVFPVMLV